MDDRTRRPDAQTVPELEPAPPEVIDKASRSRSRRRVGLIILIALLLLAGYLTFRWLHQTQQAARGRGEQATAQSVGAATVGRGDIPVTVDALGTVTPIATVTVQTQISGQLQEVAFTEGQMVKKGDLLAQIDPRPYQLLQQQYESQFEHDQALVAQAKLDLTRYQKLAQQNSIARQQYEDQVFIVQQDEASVKLDQSLIDQQKLNLTYCRIVSPVTGRIGLRLVDPGNYVQTTNSTGIAVVTQMQPITVIFPIPEDDLPEVADQLNAGALLDVSAYDRANVRLLGTGRVTALDSVIDTTTGMVKLRAQFDNANNALFPNQFVNAHLLVKTLHDVVTVPTVAIQRGAPGTYVYVINPNDTVSVHPVKIGPSNGPTTAVESGLTVGERVVTDGMDRLRDGARVTIPGESPRRGAEPRRTQRRTRRRTRTVQTPVTRATGRAAVGNSMIRKDERGFATAEAANSGAVKLRGRAFRR